MDTRVPLSGNSSGLTRSPAVAGRFYPQDAAVLAKAVRDYLREAEQQPCACAQDKILGFMLPHAGYVFSGAVAGLTLGQILKQPVLPEKIVLLGPSHTGQGAPLSVWPHGVWSTPLGELQVDAGFCSELVQASQSSGAKFLADTKGHLGEHALEVIAPFLQALDPRIKIIPVTVRNYNLQQLQEAGGLLAGIIERGTRKGEKICMIASSDMNHFLPHEENMKIDELALEPLKNLDPVNLFRTVAVNKISMCGFAAVTLMLFAAKALEADKCCITAHTSSGLTGKAFGADMHRVVGYAGAVIAAGGAKSAG
ncbi:MAG: AmmeMemoRadiSam system protein B [Deltaproteobacteria bacterium]|jgi:AmmeMemoRadiSam system protein B|nr:AmmeMemoRadiSam system protein B [Deltaproteobacteria bacterium]